MSLVEALLASREAALRQAEEAQVARGGWACTRLQTCCCVRWRGHAGHILLVCTGVWTGAINVQGNGASPGGAAHARQACLEEHDSCNSSESVRVPGAVYPAQV